MYVIIKFCILLPTAIITHILVSYVWFKHILTYTHLFIHSFEISKKINISFHAQSILVYYLNEKEYI